MSAASTNNTPSMIGELKTSLLGALALAIAGLSAGAFTVVSHQLKLSEQEFAQEQISITRTEIASLRDEIERSRLAQPEFERLRAAGIIGSLKKTELVDQFEQLVTSHPANVKVFSLGPLQTLPTIDLPLSELTLGRHQLTFKANPPHEMHLLSLLKQIDSSLGGLTLLNQCTISLQSDSNPSGQQSTLNEISLLDDGLDAQCTLDTYLFERPSQPAIAGDLPMPPRGMI